MPTRKTYEERFESMPVDKLEELITCLNEIKRKKVAPYSTRYARLKSLEKHTMNTLVALRKLLDSGITPREEQRAKEILEKLDPRKIYETAMSVEVPEERRGRRRRVEHKEQGSNSTVCTV